MQVVLQSSVIQKVPEYRQSPAQKFGGTHPTGFSQLQTTQQRQGLRQQLTKILVLPSSTTWVVQGDVQV
jgi:hypothetical protein